MKLYLESVDIKDIEWSASAGLIDGVVATPTALVGTDDGSGENARLAEICRVTALPVCVTVAAVDSEDIYAAGRALARISDNVVVQLPMIEDAVVAARKLTSEGVRVGVTLVFTAAQAVLAAKTGACMVTTSPDAITEFGLEGNVAIGEMASALRDYSLGADLFALSPRNAAEMASCMASGVDGIVVDAPTLRRLLVHPLTDRGLDALLHELSKTHRVRS